MTESRGKYLSELRRSNAAGIHGHRPSRSQIRRIAIAEGLDIGCDLDNTGLQPETQREAGENTRRKLMAVVPDENTMDTSVDPFDELEPDDEELIRLENELPDIDLDYFWPDDDRFCDFDPEEYEFVE